jgi:lipoprotein-anchoring transpeptidase ErfK/SrfK
MPSWGERETYQPRWLAVAAFCALSLPVAFVLTSPESEPAPAAANSIIPVAIQPVTPSTPLPVTAPAEASPAKPRGTKTPVSRKRVVVSIPDRKLAVVEGGHVVKAYSIAVGADGSPSPTGEFKIVNKVTDPTYYRPGLVITRGPDNPLGSRWLGLDRAHFGIHGTNEPKSIGRAASHGCIRMAQADVEELYALAQVGDTVEISEAPLEQLALLEAALGGAEGE